MLINNKQMLRNNRHGSPGNLKFVMLIGSRLIFTGKIIINWSYLIIDMVGI